MSPRNFARLFQQEVGRTPARYIEDLRLEAARRQIESVAMSFEEVAVSCGFTSAEILRRAFERRLALRLANTGPLLGALACGNRLAPDWQE